MTWPSTVLPCALCLLALAGCASGPAAPRGASGSVPAAIGLSGSSAASGATHDGAGAGNEQAVMGGATTAARAVPAETTAADGPAVLVSAGIRIPNASGFDADPQQPVQNGRLILTSRSLIWQSRAGLGFYRPPQRMAFSEIRSVALARADTRRLLVIEGPGMRHQTFALTQPDGRTLDAAGTELAWQRLLALLGLRPPQP